MTEKETLISKDDQSTIESNNASKSMSRIGLLVFSALQTFLFVGAIGGWGPMQRMMEANQAFITKCSENTDDFYPCPQQSKAIININFIACATNTLTPIMGKLIDHYGPERVAMYLMSPCAIFGAGIVSIAATYHIDLLYYIGFILLGLCTFFGTLLLVQIGLYFPNPKTQSRVIMLLSGLWDAGAVTYLLLWTIQGALDIDFSTITLWYFILAIILFGGGNYYWNPISSNDSAVQTVDENSYLLPVKQRNSRIVRDSLLDYQAAAIMQLMDTSGHGSGKFSQRQISSTFNNNLDYDDDFSSTTVTYDDDMTARTIVEGTYYGDNNEQLQGYIIIADRPVKQQLCSWPFLMLSLFFAVNMTSCNWSLSTSSIFLESIGDKAGTYLSMMTMLQPASVLTIPVADYIIHQYGFAIIFQCVNGLAITYISIKLFSVNLNVQIVTFVIIATIRCFLYAGTLAFLPKLLSAKAVGVGTGLLTMIGGIISVAINIPLNHYQANAGGNFEFSNSLFLLLTIPTLLAGYSLQRTITKKNRAIQMKNQETMGLQEIIIV